MSCDVDEVTVGLKNEQSSFSNPSVASPTSPGEPSMALVMIIKGPDKHCGEQNPKI